MDGEGERKGTQAGVMEGKTESQKCGEREVSKECKKKKPRLMRKRMDGVSDERAGRGEIR